jgi:branched-subunit amino acid transport protein
VITWPLVLALGAVSYLLRLGGLLAGGRSGMPPLAARIVALLPVALLAGLIAVQTAGGDGRLVLDARAPGVLAALVAVLLRAPFIVVMVAGVGVTALVRALL